MHRGVLENWVPYSSPIEGCVGWMYLDKNKKHLVTTAIGNMIDPVERALVLPWKLPDGHLASKEQVTSEFNALKARPELAEYRASSQVVQSATTIRLHNEDITALVKAMLLANEARMRRFFTRWDYFPADAQMGLLSLSWALGSDFELQYPKLTRAANSGDWLTCANECQIREEGNAGVIPRNVQNVLLFHNAAAVCELHTDPETLHWPAHAPTVPEHVRESAAAGHTLAPYAVTSISLTTDATENFA